MNLRRILLPCLAFACLVACLHLSAQEATATAPAAPELTLQQCITRALARNFDLEIGRYSPEIARDDIAIARAGFQPVVTVSTNVGKSSYGSTVLNPGSLDISSRSTRVGITQELTTGTTLGVSSQLDRSRGDPTTTLNPAYDADLSLSVRQQLLKGFGIAVNEAAINRARFGLDRANLGYKAQALDVIRATEGAYYDVVFAREQREVRKFTLALAQRLYDEAKVRKETGVATDLDVLSAEVGVANANRGVLLAQQAVQDTEERLLSLIGQFELEAPLGRVRFSEGENTSPVFASSFNLAKQSQPEYRSAQFAIEQARLDLLVARNGTRPNLSVGGTVGLNRQGDSYGDTVSRDDHAWQLDLSLSYPWGRTADKARFRQSEAYLHQQESRLRQLEQSIELQVRSAVRAVETNAESVRISHQARMLSDRQYELEKARFDAGLSTSYRVLQAQNDLETARVAELLAIANLHNALSTLRRIEGSSLQRYAVTLP